MIRTDLGSLPAHIHSIIFISIHKQCEQAAATNVGHIALVPVVQAAGIVIYLASLVRQSESRFMNVSTPRKLTGILSLSEVEQRKLLLSL